VVKSTISSFQDPYFYQAAIRAAHVELTVLKPGKFQAELTRIDLQRLWMQRGHQGLPCIARTVENTKRISIFFLAEPDEPAMYYNGREFDSGMIVVDQPESINHLRFATLCRWGTMSLTPEDFSAAGRSLVGREVDAPPYANVIRPDGGSNSRLLHLHRTAASLARTAPERLSHPETARALESALTHTMIRCLTDHLTILDTFGERLHSTVMARFERIMAAEPTKPLYLAEICSATGVSERTLQNCCRERLGMGPVRFLWLRRMHLARRALMNADPEITNVTTIAMQHGFGELGRFSVAYRSLFGESPSRTLRRDFVDAPVSLDSPFAAAFSDFR
jgi:AraC-like DNA-binding protein